MPTRGLRPSVPILAGFNNWVANLISVTVTFVSSFAGLWLSRAIYDHNQIVTWEDVFWPETGCSLALVALLGYRCLPGIGLGCWLAMMCFVPPSPAWCLAATYMVQAGLGRWAVRSIHPNPQFRPSVRAYIVMIGVGGVLIALPLSLVEVVTMHGSPFNDPILWQRTLIWWLGEMSSILVFTPMLLLPFAQEARVDRRRIWEFFLYATAFLAGAWFVFTVDLRGNPNVPAFFLIFSAGVMIALRNGVALSIVSNMLFYLVSILAQILWVIQANEDFISGQVVLAHCLMINVIATSLITAGGLFDHRRAENELRGVSTRVLNAQEAERRRLSRDLHDSVCQTLQAVIIRMKILAHATSEKRVENKKICCKPSMTCGCVPGDTLQSLALDLDAALDELRQNITGLRPETIDRSDFTGIVRDYCDEFAGRHHVSVELHDGDDLPVLPIQIREHLFRILQESLANAVTHGGAKHIHVEMIFEHGAFLFTVRDDGRGFDPGRHRDGRPRYGLRTMQERAFLMGGLFSIDSNPGEGALVTVEIPLKQDEPPPGIIG